jgi:putative ABC transport system permease protein
MRDLRYAIRLLLARPGFSMVAVLTLALGIGANTAIFTVVNAVLLRPLPFHDPDRLVMIAERSGTIPTLTTSWLNYQDWRAQSRSYDAFGAVRSLTMTLTGGSEPERVPAKMVTASLLAALGTPPALGRTLTEIDDRPGAPGVVVLSDALWRRRFGGAADVIGRSITLDDQPFTIVGVMPPRFRILAHADLFAPMGPWAATLPDDRGWHPGLWPIARLKPGVPLAQAQAELNVITSRLGAQYPAADHDVRGEVQRLQDYAVENVRPALLVLIAAVGLVLLIACANVANLLLARAVGRRKEIAIRTAIGATWRDIARQMIVESIVLASAGGAVGLFFGWWSLPLLARLTVSSAPGAADGIALDPAALGFTAAISLATGCLFGLAPALQTARVDVATAVKEAGVSNAAGGGHQALRRTLVVAEIAMATMLLIGALLLTQSMMRLQDVELGFNPSGLLVSDVPLSPISYGSSGQRGHLVDRLLPRLRRIPGVNAATVATTPPFDGAGLSLHFNIPGRPPKGPEAFTITGYRGVTTGYFSTLGIPLVAGRDFTDRDRENSKPVAIVNDAFVRRFFRGDRAEALRARTQIGALPNDEAPVLEIVGVVGDTKQAFETTLQPTIYVPYLQPPIDLLGTAYRNVAIVLRTDGDPAALAPSLRAAMREIDPDQPLVAVRTMTASMADSVTAPRLRSLLLIVLSGVALALALVGVYGVMAYAVSERAREIGVRMALGASARDIRALVVGEGARLAIAGVVVGLAGAAAATRALGALLVGVSATDPATFLLAAIGLGGAAVAAAYGPARRAARIDPAVLLR